MNADSGRSADELISYAACDASEDLASLAGEFVCARIIYEASFSSSLLLVQSVTTAFVGGYATA